MFSGASAALLRLVGRAGDDDGEAWEGEGRRRLGIHRLHVAGAVGEAADVSGEHRFVVVLRDDLDRTIGAIPYLSDDPQGDRPSLGKGAKSDALDVTHDDNANGGHGPILAKTIALRAKHAKPP